MFDFVCYAILGYIVFSLGLNYLRHFQQIRKYQDGVYAHLQRIIHTVRYEQDGDMYYWYDQDTDEFIVQGRTDTEIIQALRARFPNHIFVINEHQMMVGPEFAIIQFDKVTASIQ